jgi:hypothetical protein
MEDRARNNELRRILVEIMGDKSFGGAGLQ